MTPPAQVTSPALSQQSAKKMPAEKHFLAAFFLSFSWGMFGVDRMYLGKWGTGIVKLLTLGGLGVWTVFDLYRIMSGTARDAWGRPLLQAAEYKRFARRFILIFAIIMGILLVVNGVALSLALTQLVTGLQGGSGAVSLPSWMTQLVPSNYMPSAGL